MAAAWPFARADPPKVQWLPQPQPTAPISRPSSLCSNVTDPAVELRSLTAKHPIRSSQDALSANHAAPRAEPVRVFADAYNENRTKYTDVVSHAGVNYSVLGALGEGSFGRVFFALTQARDLVALKVLHKYKLYRMDGSRASVHTEREALALAVKHNITSWAKLRAAWEDNLNIFMAMVRRASMNRG